MEQPALLTIIRTETTFRFRLDLPDSPSPGGQDYVVDFTA